MDMWNIITNYKIVFNNFIGLVKNLYTSFSNNEMEYTCIKCKRKFTIDLTDYSPLKKCVWCENI